MAFLAVLRGESESINLKLSSTESIRLEGSPLRVTSPVSTSTIDQMPNDGEETDLTTLGNIFLEDED